MDLHYSQTLFASEKSVTRFTTLWIYTILKHARVNAMGEARFTTLWIYTILKHESERFQFD